ncbi:hypothetical protein E4U41_007355 [Claviceps citrina]|nr:hypothetical protein E4U41_007355 [Claviceps citrina]
MEPRPALESARTPPASIPRVGQHRREVTAPGGHHSFTSHSTFKTEAMRQADIKVKAHLRRRRLRDASVTLAGESEPLRGKGSQLYFLSDGDIKDIVGLVMDALRQGLMAPARREIAQGSEVGANLDDSAAPGFEYRRNSITPRLSSAADPATTISLPKTVFSYTKWGDGGVSVADSRRDSSTKTTIVSRGSVSEIVWTEHRSSDVSAFRDSLSSAGNLTDAACQHRLGHHTLFKCDGCRNMIEAERADSIFRVASLLPTSTNPVMGKRADRSTDEESNITSFPELRPRNCTNDWLKPPVEIEQLLRDQPSDMYRRGVDAHSGLMPGSPQSITEPPVSFPMPRDDGLFNKNSLFSAGPYVQERWVTETTLGDGRTHLRDSTNSVSYGHRASQVPAASQSPWQSEGELFPHIVSKLRQNSQDDVREEDVHTRKQGAWPTPGSEVLLPPPDPPSLAMSTRSRDSIIRERTLKPPTADKLGIYEALTGSRMRTLKKRCGNCSEDNRPHVCKDDLEGHTSLG